MKVDTSYYRFAHNTAPKGSGTWVFEPSNGNQQLDFIQAKGLYSEAKKYAVQEAKKLKWPGIKLCS